MEYRTILRDVGKNRDWITREKIEKIIDRYTYDIIEHLRVVRHKNCAYGLNGKQICTCGLLTDLMGIECVLAEELYPKFLEEVGNHQRSLGLMMPA